MKKIFLVSAVMLAAVLTGCGGKNSSSEAETTTELPQETTEVSTEIESWAPLATTRERNIVSTDEDFNYEVYEGHAIITSYKGSAQEVVVPDEIGGAPVGEIGFYAFEAKDFILTVTLPDSVTKIDEGAFMGCTSMYSINIPPTLAEIQRGAFVDCTALTDITLPQTVTRVQEEAFTGCNALESLIIENPDLAYEFWGLEELPMINVSAPEGSAASVWAEKINNGEPVQ